MQTASSATIRQDIADALRENLYGRGEFIGTAVMPIYGVTGKSGNFAKIAFAQQPTSSRVARAPGAGYSRQIREGTSDSYACEEFGREEPIDDGERANLGKYFDVELDAAESAAGVILLEQEARIAAIMHDYTTSFAGCATDGSAWATASTGTPIKDVRAAIVTLKKQINGGIPVTAKIVAACTDATLDNALNTTEVANKLMYAQKGMIDREAMVEALAVTMGLNAIFHTSIQRAGASVWTDNVFGIYITADGLNLKSVPQCARTFLWTADCADNALAETYRDETVRSDVVRVRQHVDEKLISARCGHILYGLS